MPVIRQPLALLGAVAITLARWAHSTGSDNWTAGCLVTRHRLLLTMTPRVSRRR